MTDLLRRTLRGALRRAGVAVMSNARYERLEMHREELARMTAAINLIFHFPEQQCASLLKSAHDSKAQLFQDLFVLSELNLKRDGYFVEFGATNGVDLSNTFLLERQFGWKGILAEPGRVWLDSLKKNRRCDIETACVWRESGSEVTFNATDVGELATVDVFSAADHHSESRKFGEKYSVKTISLIDMLDKYAAPRIIDYLSIDTEGSEYEILHGFDFDKYKFRVITCEHNFTPQREQLFSLLSRNGYSRKFEELSEFDDWYVGRGVDEARAVTR